MDTNDDFYGKELNLVCLYMHANFEQKYPKTAIVCRGIFFSKLIKVHARLFGTLEYVKPSDEQIIECNLKKVLASFFVFTVQDTMSEMSK